MQPTVPVPTDNIYKFACLFGLALVIAAIFSYVAVYASSLDRKVKYAEAVIMLEAKQDRSKVETDLLALNQRLLKITKSNEGAAFGVVAFVLLSGVALAMFGSMRWFGHVQKRDDQIAQLQLRKLAAEVRVLEIRHPIEAGARGSASRRKGSIRLG